MDIRSFYFILFYFFSSPLASDAYGYRLKVNLVNNGPAVLDANVTFTVRLSNPSGVVPSGPFYCIFYDELGQSFTTETLNAVMFNFTTSYPSSRNKKGYYRMDVTVYKTEFLFPVPQGSATTSFELTETLNGHIAAIQKNSSQHLSPHFVSTGEETQLMVKFHDPEDFLSQAQDLIFYWFVNDVNYGTTKTPVLKFNFTEVKNHTVMVDVYATFAVPTTTTSTTTTTTTTTPPPTTTATSTTTTTTITSTVVPTILPPTTSEASLSTTSWTNLSLPHIVRSKRKSAYTQHDRFIGYKVALFTLELQARDPVSNVSIHGNNWLKHGDIMNMNITCNGSAPFYYCWAFDGFMNETNNASCELPIKTNNCEVQLLHYFSSPGQYILPVVLYNQVFYQVIPLKVNIYEADRKAQLSLVVVPIASACVAIVSIAFGIGLYFYTRRNLRIEVADFDFEEEDVGNPESFSGRLRSSILQYWSSLKGQTPPANMSYQNITFD